MDYSRNQAAPGLVRKTVKVSAFKEYYKERDEREEKPTKA